MRITRRKETLESIQNEFNGSQSGGKKVSLADLIVLAGCRPGRAPDEIDDPAVRAVKLLEWIDLPRHVYARLEDGTRVRHAFDPRQLGADRVSSVQYLKFPVGGRVPVGFGIDLPQLTEETTLTSEQRRALEADVVPDR
jgi:Protein of unknown function (DUF3501)